MTGILILLLIIICILYLFNNVLYSRVILNDCDGSKRSFIEALEKWDSIKIDLERDCGKNIITKRVYLSNYSQWCVDYEVGEKIKYEDLNFIERN